jgi:hypothetical protein
MANYLESKLRTCLRDRNKHPKQKISPKVISMNLLSQKKTEKIAGIEVKKKIKIFGDFKGGFNNSLGDEFDPCRRIRFWNMGP